MIPIWGLIHWERKGEGVGVGGRVLHQRLQVKSLLTHVHLHVDDRTIEAQNYMFKSLCSG